MGCGEVKDAELVHGDAGDRICDVEWELHQDINTSGLSVGVHVVDGNRKHGIRDSI